MTKREFLQLVINETAQDEVLEYAQTELEKLDAKNKNRKPTKQQIENEQLMTKIMEILADGTSYFGSDIATKLEISPNRANALLRKLFEMEKTTRTKAKNGKGTAFMYTVA